MKHHLNILFVTTQGAWLHKKGDTVLVDIEKKTKLRLPLHNLEAIIGFGRVSYSPYLLAACAEAGIRVSMMTEYGRFLATLDGYQPGNVLLRRQQYRMADSPESSTHIVRSCIAAKVANSRYVLLRCIRDHGDPSAQLHDTCIHLADSARRILQADNVDQLRGLEGDAAARYFAVLPLLLTLKDDDERSAFTMNGRSRRPPLDRFNALLSFLYTLLMNDCRSAAASVGLDCQVGYLHADRPGRPSLALDLMEEFRAILADRCVLSLINRQQIKASDFEFRESGAVYLTDSARKTVIQTWQKRKEKTYHHPFIDEKITIGFMPLLQARLLARHIRGDIDSYPAIIWE